KLDLATRMGAHHALDAGAKDAVPEVMRITGGGGADVAIDTVGGEETVIAGIDVLRPGGRFSAFAVSHACVPSFTTFPLYYKEITLIGSRALLPHHLAPSLDLPAPGPI